MSKGSGSAGRAGSAPIRPAMQQVDRYAMSEEARKSAMEVNARSNSEYIAALRESEGRGGPLTLEEAAAIYEYTNYGSWDRADTILSGGNLSDSQKALVATTDNALKKLPEMKSKTYRGIGMSDAELVKLKVGGTWISPNYMSTAASRVNAENFADSRADGNNRVILRVTGGARDITRYSRYRMEREGLVPRNTSYRITKITRRGDYTYVDLER